MLETDVLVVGGALYEIERQPVASSASTFRAVLAELSGLASAAA